MTALACCMLGALRSRTNTTNSTRDVGHFPSFREYLLHTGSLSFRVVALFLSSAHIHQKGCHPPGLAFLCANRAAVLSAAFAC